MNSMFSRGERPSPGQTRSLYQSSRKVSKDWSPRSSMLESSRICSCVHSALRQSHISAPRQPVSPHLGHMGLSSRMSAG